VVVHDRARLYNPEVKSEERGDERLEHFQEIPRQEAYLADITYGTNNEFGFDYLRDNMVQHLAEMVQRQDTPHHFAIVDEADSILIDEARTPLIISAPDTEPTKKYFDYAHMVKSLVKDVDYKLDEKAKTATLTDLGVKRIEQKLGVKNLYEENFDTIHLVESSLKAMSLYRRDTEYIVRDNQVIIVDEHTGRLMYGRRYSDGLHQAIEAKEGVPIQQESRTLATISLQNYFRMYAKLAGMTGTAITEAEEFKKIYNMDVLSIPTNVPAIRVDEPDVVYKTTAAKYSAIAREVEKIHATGRPILIGTRSIEHNQMIANFLKRKNIPHQILNAKNNEKEAFIIADAGKNGAITVATNIAGRGVDIILGGAKPERKDYPKATEFKKAVTQWQKNHDEVVETGGLFIIGTERHESRRIDNQLRGRAGRQGDPGTSQFFVSLEDEIMRLFGGEQIAKIMDFLKIEEDQPIQHNMVSKSIESAQVKVEGFFFDQRKRLVEFDDVMNKQREIIYKRRRRLLEAAENLKEEVLKYIEAEVESLVSLRAPEKFTDEEYDAIVKEFIRIIPFDDNSQAELRESLKKYTSTEEIVDRLMDLVKQTYQTREEVVGENNMRMLEKVVMLSTIDEKWMDHLDEMDNLRDGIWLRGDKQTVLSEYKKEGFGMFEALIGLVESTVTARIFRVHLQQQPKISIDLSQAQEKKEDIHESLTKEVADATLPQAASAPQSTQGNLSDLAAALKTAKGGSLPTPGSKQIKIGRNDPCPCGSGLKYKKCGLINAPEHRG
jgi:preprotein translocase subunit SecA